MDFKELGHILRAEREKQGLSVADVHERIKIGPSSIEAIEEGKQDNLPHMVYYKGFVRNYAVFLGLDPAECLKAFETDHLSLEEEPEQTEEGEASPGTTTITEEFSDVETGSKKRLISIIVTLCLLIIVGWLLTKLFVSPPAPPEKPVLMDGGQEETLPPESGNVPLEGPEVTPPLLTDESGVQPETDGGQAETGLDLSSEQNPVEAPQTDTGAAEDTELEASTPQETIDETRDQTAATPTTPEAPEAEEQAAATGEQILKISASEACWLSASMDDREKDIYLRPGESISLRFEQELSVKLGNAGGVKLALNGKPYPLQADSGEVMTLTLP